MLTRRLLAVCTLGLMIHGLGLLSLRPAVAEDATLTSQPWAKWDNATRPVRGGTFRLAGPLYIGKMNPNHWPVNDWVTMSRFMERIYVNDGGYEPSVMWLTESLTYESPTVAIMTLRKGVTFHDGSPFNASSVKHQFDWIRDPENGAWTAGSVAPIESIEIIDEHRLRWTLKHPWASFAGMARRASLSVTRPRRASHGSALRSTASLWILARPTQRRETQSAASWLVRR